MSSCAPYVLLGSVCGRYASSPKHKLIHLLTNQTIVQANQRLLINHNTSEQIKLKQRQKKKKNRRINGRYHKGCHFFNRILF